MYGLNLVGGGLEDIDIIYFIYLCRKVVENKVLCKNIFRY